MNVVEELIIIPITMVPIYITTDDFCILSVEKKPKIAIKIEAMMKIKPIDIDIETRTIPAILREAINIRMIAPSLFSRNINTVIPINTVVIIAILPLG